MFTTDSFMNAEIRYRMEQVRKDFEPRRRSRRDRRASQDQK